MLGTNAPVETSLDARCSRGCGPALVPCLGPGWRSQSLRRWLQPEAKACTPALRRRGDDVLGWMHRHGRDQKTGLEESDPRKRFRNAATRSRYATPYPTIIVCEYLEDVEELCHQVQRGLSGAQQARMTGYRSTRHRKHGQALTGRGFCLGEHDISTP